MKLIDNMIASQNYYFILDDNKNVVPAPDYDTYFREYQEGNRILFTKFQNGDHISTIFLGINHGYHPGMGYPIPPIVFETMIFADDSNNSLRSRILRENHYSEYQTRCCTYDDALQMHIDALLLYFINDRMPSPPKDRLREEWRTIKAEWANEVRTVRASYEDALY